MSDKHPIPEQTLRQPGFGPRQTDSPGVDGYEPDLPDDLRDSLRDRQPLTETMEAADLPADRQPASRGDEPDQDVATQADRDRAGSDPDAPPVARLGPTIGLAGNAPAGGSGRG